MNSALAARNFPTHEAEAYYGMVGWGLDELVRKALPEGAEVETVTSEIKEAWTDYYREHPADKAVPYEGIPELLSVLVEANLSLGVLSNKPDELAKRTVEELLPARYFASIRGQSDEFPRKPDPNSLLHMLAELRVAPEEACLVGDSEIDMETARNAGVTAVAVGWGFRDLETLRRSGAEIVAHSAEELREHLLNR